MMEWLMVAFGGGIGATLRYGVQVSIAKIHFPPYYSTVFVNLLGSFLLGIAANWGIVNQTVIAFLTIGMLGGFTTFSTFSFDVVKLIDKQEYAKTGIYLLCTLVGGLLFFWIGWNL